MYLRLGLLTLFCILLLAVFGAAPQQQQDNGVGTGTGGVGTGTGGVGSTIPLTTTTYGIVAIDEKRSASSYGYFGSPPSWQTLTGRHIAGARYMITTTTTQIPTPPGTDITSEEQRSIIEVATGTELGYPSGSNMLDVELFPGSGNYGGGFLSGSYFDVQTSSTDAIASGNVLEYWIGVYVVYHHADGSTTNGTVQWCHYKYALMKNDCGDASVTTRKTYGQPNGGSGIPATDPNAPLRNVKYGGWTYNGGLFVGFMPALGQDASGTARADFFVTTEDPNYANSPVAGLSLFDMGTPQAGASGEYTGLSGGFDVGLYVSSVPSGLGESSVDWANQLSITPDGSYASHISLTDGSSNDYLVFSFPPGSVGMALAMVNESNYTSGSSMYWHYFASDGYKGALGANGFPFDDSEPRVWYLVAQS